MNGEADRGCIVRIAGPAVEAEGLESVELGDIATVGKEKLLAEVIRVERTRAVLQVFEDTTGLQVGEPVASTGSPLSVDLGPGLLGQIYDGIQRPLESLQMVQGAFLTRGVSAPALTPDRRWEFVPRVQAGDHVLPAPSSAKWRSIPVEYIEYRHRPASKVKSTRFTADAALSASR